MSGWAMKATRRSRMMQQTATPQAAATRARKILFLSSSGCSRKRMEAIRSSSISGGLRASVDTSGIGDLWRGGGIYFMRLVGWFAHRIQLCRIAVIDLWGLNGAGESL